MDEDTEEIVLFQKAKPDGVVVGVTGIGYCGELSVLIQGQRVGSEVELYSLDHRRVLVIGKAHKGA